MRAYYNEFDKKTAAWLRELIKANLIMEGDVDERSITEVRAADLAGYDRVHFFAGIGGWELALQIAGWPDDLPVWTGSCPCQPFSSAGKQKGVEDERHLWPVFFNLIRECRPDVVFGEQVEGAVGKGWLDGVSGDLESEGYACGHCVLGAHSLGAPHIRQRLYWVADSSERGGISGAGDGQGVSRTGDRNTDEVQIRQEREKGFPPERKLRFDARNCCDSNLGGVANSEHTERRSGSEEVRDAHGRDGSGRGGDVGRMANNNNLRRLVDSEQRGERSARDGAQQSAWSGFRIIPCRDGKHRRIPTEPAFFPLADGLPARVVRLRGYGNAIVPQVAAAFIEAYLDCGSHLTEDLI